MPNFCTARLTISSRRDGLTILFDGLLQDLDFKPLLGIHLLEPDVIGLKLFQPSDHEYNHAAIFGTPLVEGSGADTQHPA